jgi:hypothetical protein
MTCIGTKSQMTRSFQVQYNGWRSIYLYLAMTSLSAQGIHDEFVAFHGLDAITDSTIPISLRQRQVPQFTQNFSKNRLWALSMTQFLMSLTNYHSFLFGSWPRYHLHPNHQGLSTLKRITWVYCEAFSLGPQVLTKTHKG